MKESEVLHNLLLAGSKISHEHWRRLWRNNRGVGRFLLDKKGLCHACRAEQKVRYVVYGVGGNGGSDTIGMRRLWITEDMVGKSIGQFVAIEAKGVGGKVNKEQDTFLQQVGIGGGLALVVDQDTNMLELFNE